MEVVENKTKAKIKTLQTKLKECQTEKSTHLEDLQRAKAEFLNAKKRLEEEKTALVGRTENDCIEKLLPLCDSFKMAMGNQDTWQAVSKEWRTGVESIYGQLQQTLTSYGVTETGKVGENFDPEWHEAMAEEETGDEKAVDKVIKVLQTGYLRDKNNLKTLIRPARVIVGIKKSN